jgi:hypothetical protein
MTITLRLLTTSDVDDLWPRLRLEDKEECICLGNTPREALLMGALDNVFSFSQGRAYALVEDDIIIGALGFSCAGCLWALSTKFNTRQLRELFKRTPEFVLRLLKEAETTGALMHPFLSNIIHARNKVAMRWMKASKCFNIGTDYEVASNDEIFYPFATKPISEILAAHV